MYCPSIRKAVLIGITLIGTALIASCTTAPVVPMPPLPQPRLGTVQTVQFPFPSGPISRQDAIHVVGPGETIWRIGKIYDVKIDDIIEANRLESSTQIEMGRKLLIPNAAPLRPIIPLYSTDKWQYIIIHHSATDGGNALSFYQMHLRRGFWNGLGYHFVIDNGTYGKENGQIEISPRWIKQQNGAHCKASNMNEVGIGICLVGNFSKGDVSAQQMDSLVNLVKILKKFYSIPDDNIMGHGSVPGASTECPGREFPWGEFWSQMKAKDNE